MYTGSRCFKDSDARRLGDHHARHGVTAQRTEAPAPTTLAAAIATHATASPRGAVAFTAHAAAMVCDALAITGHAKA